MRVAALLERTASGWRGWAPALPGVEVQAPTASAAEEDLARAIEVHVRERWADGTFVAPPEIVAFAVDVRRRRLPERAVVGDEERDRTLAQLDGRLDGSVRLPRAVLDAVFRYRRELVDAAGDEPEPEPEGEALPPNVVLFTPRD
ncbi:MAG: hypothetical protein KJ062_08380 [Thermoanaerobaculia bacterium]|nr:hypothetical protein [Thermoanaerobaculia bacterium]